MSEQNKNYVELIQGIEKKLRFKADSLRYEPRKIMDPQSKVEKTVNATVLDVIEEDGRAVTKQFSTLAMKLSSQLVSLSSGGSLYGRVVGIKKTGAGYTTEFAVNVY